MKKNKITDKTMGTVKVGEKGQIVIPKDVRELWEIKTGDTLIVLSDIKRGIAIVKSDVLEDFAEKILSETKKGNKK